MPVPAEYGRAGDHFYAFLMDAKEASGLVTTNQSYTMTQGVFQVFRRRIDLKEAIRFANILPTGLRALFVADWDPEEPKQPFTDIPTMTQEVRALRFEHNLSPDNAIKAVATALRKHVDEAKLEHLLEAFAPEAKAFWS